MFHRKLLAAALAVALSGCVSPLVEPDRAEWQHRAGDARDWQEMAKRTVAAIPLASSGQSYNVYVQSDGSPFGDVYKDFLEEALFAKGFPVLRTPQGADIAIAYEVKPLNYAPGGKKRLADYFGPLAVIGGVGTQLAKITSRDTGVAAGLGVAAAGDYAGALNGATDAEVVVVTRIESPRTNNFHFLRSETVYVRPADLKFYNEGAPVVALQVSDR
jgi:hypothetical protein